MWELDIDGGSGGANPSLWKQVLQENAWHVVQRTETNKYLWQQVSILTGRQELLLSTVERSKLSWFGYICRHCTLPRIVQQRKVDGIDTVPKIKLYNVAEEGHVNHRMTTLRNGQASRCRHCCASQTIEVDCQSSLRMHLSEYPNDAWASRELVSQL